MQNNFFAKLFTNVLSTYKGSVGDDCFIERLCDCGCVGTKWRDKFAHMREAYQKANPEEAKFGYVRAKSFCTKANIDGFTELMLREVPAINDPFILHPNTQIVAELLELKPIEVLILDLALRLSKNPEYYESKALAVLSFDDSNKDSSILYGRLFNLDPSDIRKTMQGFLFKSGFLVPSQSIPGLHSINNEMIDMFTAAGLNKENIEQFLFPSNLSTELGTENYPHFKKEIAICEGIIGTSLTNKARGTNIMFWGIPGTGKTEMALALARKNDWKLKIIGDISDADNKEKSRTQRLTSLKIAMKLYARTDGVVLLFDEMEDLFKNDSADFSKAFINRIIETTQLPIIWTTNNLELLGSAVLRRMVYNIGFMVPPVHARRQIWQTYAKKYELKLEANVIERLAVKYDMVPALISNAAKITHMSGLAEHDIDEVLTSLDTLVNYGEKRRFDQTEMKDTPYDLSFLNADADMRIVTDKLIKAKPNFSMCFYGAPGTGKTEYGRYLAKRLDKRVLYKRVSDLQSMWLGECEKNIAQAFQQSKEDEMVLIIDEGDSFLQSRAKAQRSWEVSQVNEMLSQMEAHTQPFIITTNLMDSLDEASLRRFTFKIKFDFLRPEQAAKLFTTYFKLEAPKAILSNHILTPGDFAAVRKKVDVLGIDNAGEIHDMLEQECSLKPQQSKKMGF